MADTEIQRDLNMSFVRAYASLREIEVAKVNLLNAAWDMILREKARQAKSK